MSTITSAAGAGSPRRTKEARVATTAEMAVVNFEPWEHSPDEWAPPSDEEWSRLANPYLVTLRIAWMVHFKTKAEVMDIVDDLDDDSGRELMGGFVSTVGFFKGALAILEGAEARILCAGSALIERDEANSAEGAGHVEE